MTNNSNPSSTQSNSTTTVIAWLSGIAIFVLILLDMILIILNMSTVPIDSEWGFRGFQAAIAIPFTIIGVLLAVRQPHNPIGWLFLLSSALGVLSELAGEYAYYAKPGDQWVMPFYEKSEWAGYVADVCARLVRDTGMDCIYLDELGIAFPDYNPEKSPLREDGVPVSPDRQAHVQILPIYGVVGQRDHRAQRAGVAVHLGLREVERVLALDIAAADVVADRVAYGLCVWIHDQRQFRFRHAPVAIAPQPDPIVGADDLAPDRLEKDLGTFSLIHPDVNLLRLRLPHPGLPAPGIGDTCCPHFLLIHWRQQVWDIGGRRAVQSGIGIG